MFDGLELTAGGDKFFVLGMLLLRSMPEELPPLGFVRFKALIFDASLVSSDLRDSVNTSLFSIKIEVLSVFLIN